MGTQRLTPTMPVDQQQSIIVHTEAQRGHSIPAARLALSLARRGHKVIFTLSRSMIEREVPVILGAQLPPNLTVRGIDDGRSVQEWDSQGPHKLSVRGAELTRLLDTFRLSHLRAAESAIAVLKDVQPALVIVDMMGFGVFDAARICNVPAVVNLPGQLTMGVKLFGGLGLPTRMSQYVFSGVLGLDSMMGFMGGVGFIMRSVKTVVKDRAMLCHSVFGLDAPVEIGSNITMVGPSVNFSDDAASQAPSTEDKPSVMALRRWLEAGDGQPIVYVSMGSMSTGNAENMRQMAEGLLPGAQRGEYRLLWSLKQKFWESAGLTAANQEWYESGNVFVSGWLPQADVLKRPDTKVFVSHGGWGGTTEGLVSGTPLVVLPFFGDQPGNGALVQSRHFGKALEPVKGKHNDPLNCVYGSADIADAVKSVLIDPSYMEAVAECAEKIRSTDSEQLIHDVVEAYCREPQTVPRGGPVMTQAGTEAQLQHHIERLSDALAKPEAKGSFFDLASCGSRGASTA